EPLEDRASLGNFAAMAMDAGALKLNLWSSVAGLLGTLKGFQGFIVLLLVDQSAAEIEKAERGLDLLELLDRLAHVAEEIVGDAQLQMEFLGQYGRRRFQFLAQRIGYFAE